MISAGRFDRADVVALLIQINARPGTSIIVKPSHAEL
jgi:hypothetical protein